MKYEDLSISNLILIMLNSSNSDVDRKWAELELRARARKYDFDYDDIANIDNDVIYKRGLDINNYLISNRVSMQMLMECYFKYWAGSNGEDLLFSEKHLCNERDFKITFFSKICLLETQNIERRLNTEELEELAKLINARILLNNRNLKFKSDKEHKKDMWLLNDSLFELYKNGIYDSEDILSKLDALAFVREDSSKLKHLKDKLLNQAKNGYRVDYKSDEMKRTLKI